MPTNLELVAKLDEVMQLLHALPNEVSNAHFRNIVRPVLEVKTWLQFNGAATSSYCSNLERDNAAKQSEIERLEKMMVSFDCDVKRCGECGKLHETCDVPFVGAEESENRRCPKCIDEAKAYDAYEAQADRDIDSNYNASR